MKIDSTVVALEDALRLDLKRLSGAEQEGHSVVFSNRHTEDVHVFGICCEIAGPKSGYRELMLRVCVSSWSEDSITGDVIWVRSRAEYPLVEEKIAIAGISNIHVVHFRKKWPDLCRVYKAALKRRGPRE